MADYITLTTEIDCGRDTPIVIGTLHCRCPKFSIDATLPYFTDDDNDLTNLIMWEEVIDSIINEKNYKRRYDDIEVKDCKVIITSQIIEGDDRKITIDSKIFLPIARRMRKEILIHRN